MLRFDRIVLALCLLAADGEASCGDSVVENGEECDDGNATGGDACDAICRRPWAFVIAGQSNAEGRSTLHADAVSGRVTTPDALDPTRVSRAFRARHLFQGGGAHPTWVDANDFPCAESQCTELGGGCVGRTAATHPDNVGAERCECECGSTVSTRAFVELATPWPTFSERIMQDAGREVRLVAVARGATALVAADGGPPAEPLWDPDVDCTGRSWSTHGAWEDERGDLYCLLLHAVAVSGVGAELKAVLWYQGEDDANAGVPRAVYAAALETLATKLWDQLGVPLVVAPVSLCEFPGDPCNAWSSLSPKGQIRLAQLDAIATHPRILAGPVTDDLEHEDVVHVRDVVTLGERWAAAARQAILPQCDDGSDNDGDGLVDVADPGCVSAWEDDEGNAFAACDDGIDDDEDGLVDFPADPGCASPTDSTETAACGDGMDNDGDGAADAPSDPGCDDPDDDSERAEGLPCDDGVDDDGDGLADADDPQCFHSLWPSENPQCSDGIDNDGDGRIDWDGAGGGAADPQCGSPYGLKETSPTRRCGVGIELVLAMALFEIGRRRVRNTRAGTAAVSRGSRAASPRGSGCP